MAINWDMLFAPNQTQGLANSITKRMQEDADRAQRERGMQMDAAAQGANLQERKREFDLQFNKPDNELQRVQMEIDSAEKIAGIRQQDVQLQAQQQYLTKQEDRQYELEKEARDRQDKQMEEAAKQVPQMRNYLQQEEQYRQQRLAKEKDQAIEMQKMFNQQPKDKAYIDYMKAATGAKANGGSLWLGTDGSTAYRPQQPPFNIGGAF